MSLTETIRFVAEFVLLFGAAVAGVIGYFAPRLDPGWRKATKVAMIALISMFAISEFLLKDLTGMGYEDRVAHLIGDAFCATFPGLSLCVHRRDLLTADFCAGAAEHWRSTEAIGTRPAFEDHLARFPNCAFSALARERIAELDHAAAISHEKVKVESEPKKTVGPVPPVQQLPVSPYASGPPTISSVTPIAAVNSQYIVVTGRGFGNTSPQIKPIGDGSLVTLACSTTTPSLAIWNKRAGNGWAAGRATCANFDAIGLIPNQNPSPPFWWSDNVIVLWGFGSALGKSPYNIAPGDPLSIAVFGPNNSGMATFNESVVDESVALLPGANKVRVPANQAWTDTGISLRGGDLVSIKAAGLVRFAADNRPQISPAGFPPNCNAMAPGGWRGSFPAPELPCESLLGRVGQNGAIFEVGVSRTIKALEAGELYLGINDNNVGDNSGDWTVSVLIEH